MHYRKLLNYDYLSAEDFDGKDVTLTIAKVGREKIPVPPSYEPEEKLVIRFDKTDRGFVCNKTNAKSIAKLHGTDADKWTGKQVTLYPAKVRAFGKQELAIRVREK